MEFKLWPSHQIRLNLNEHPLDWEEEVKEAVLKNVKATCWNRYVDWSSSNRCLADKLAKQVGCDSSFISTGVGSSYLISHLISILDFNAKQTVVVAPSYPYINYCLSLNQVNYQAWALSRYKYNFDQIMSITSDAIVFAISPHNPTGVTFSCGEIERVLKEKRNILFIVDQAYIEFSSQACDLVRLVAEYDNLILLRTFSKAFSAAALRFGYIITSATDITTNIHKVIHPFSLNPLTFHFANYILDNYSIVGRRVKLIKEERERIKNALKDDTRLYITDSEANFIFVEVKNRNRLCRIKQNLRYHSIMTQEGVNSLRITIGTPADNEQIISILRCE